MNLLEEEIAKYLVDKGVSVEVAGALASLADKDIHKSNLLRGQAHFREDVARALESWRRWPETVLETLKRVLVEALAMEQRKTEIETITAGHIARFVERWIASPEKISSGILDGKWREDS